MPQKLNEQAKDTSARGGAQGDARFLFGLRAARDETAAEFRDDLRSARTMGDAQRDFAKRLKRWCKTFPALLAGFAQTLWERGLNIKEVERELDNIRPKVVSEAEAKNFIAACDGEPPTPTLAPAPDYRAPAYLAGFPVTRNSPRRNIPIETLHRRLDVNGTERIVAAVQSFIQEHHDVAYDVALDYVRGLAGKKSESSGTVANQKRAARRRVVPIGDPGKMRVAMFKRKYSSDASDNQKMCAHLDLEGVSVVPEWGKKSWREAWADKAIRRKVSRYLSGIPLAKKEKH
jgi:hypothetical protein